MRKLKPEVRDEVLQIYDDDEVSYSLPDMKYAGLRFMLFTLSEVYAVYLRKCCTERIVAEKMFEALKPKHIRTLQDTPLCGACCEYCANFAKMREALIALGIKGIPRNHVSAIEETLCSFRSCEHYVTNLCNAELPKKECVLHNCENCGVTAYERKIILNSRARMSLLKKVSWKQWEQVKYINKNGKEKKKTDIVHHMGLVVNLMKCYFKQLKFMSAHQFFKIWQLCNFNLSLSNLWRGQVLFMHDFQQNLLLLTQDEMLAAHWDHPQLTIHPTSLFYLCLKCDKIVKEDLIHISMDKNHDKHAVNQFTAASIEHIHKKGIPMEEIIEFTDHASAQYKSRYTFYYVTKLDIPCTRHYFGVKHGKGPPDRAGDNFKRTIRAAVKAGHELLHVNAVEEYCKVNFDRQELCPGDVMKQSEECDVTNQHDETEQCYEKDVRPTKNPHSLFKVFNHSAIRQPKGNPHIGEIKGCRDNMHAVRNTGIEGVVQYRMVDCACTACTTHEGECEQKDFADDWITVNLLKHSKDVDKVKISEWFKPIHGSGAGAASRDLMEFGDEDDCEINCDEIDSDVDPDKKGDSDETSSDKE